MGQWHRHMGTARPQKDAKSDKAGSKRKRPDKAKGAGEGEDAAAATLKPKKSSKKVKETPA